MIYQSPADALGSDAEHVRSLVVNVVRARHERAVEGHLAAESRYTMDFGTQWRDLLVDCAEALTAAGYQTMRLRPGGQTVGVVGGCLIYPWRMPDDSNALRGFASSATRQQMFHATASLEPMLWQGTEPQFDTLDPSATALREAVESPELLQTLLVTYKSSPRGLYFIDWAIAHLDEAGRLTLSGQETIWKPEPEMDEAAGPFASFDSGSPIGPLVQTRAEPRPHDA